MPLCRRDAPFTFEPRDPTQSEIYPGLSCSEDELDEAARASKRRRIEKRAQDYLDGKPLYIFSASLRGPFDKNWTNPWKRAKPHTANPTPNTRILNQGRVGTTPVTETKNNREESELRSPKRAPSLKGELSGLETSGSTGRLTKSGKNARGVVKRKDNKTRVDSDRTSIPPSSISRFSTKERDEHPVQSAKTHSASSKEGWLKRRPKDQLHIEPLKSPSPTPVGRQRGATDTPTGGKKIPRASVETSGFTPINHRRYTNAPAHTTTSSPASESLSKDGGINNLQRSSNRNKGSNPRNLITGNNSPCDEATHRSTKKPASETVDTRNNIVKHTAPGDANHFEFEYSRPNPSSNTCTKTKQPVSERNLPVNETADLGESGVSFHDFAYGIQKPMPEGSSHTQANVRAEEHKCVNQKGDQHPEGSSNENPSLAPNTFETDGGTTETMMSHNITSAQPPPEYAKIPAEIVSLQSTCFAELKNNTMDTDSIENNEQHISTQAAVSTAQRSFQDALATPDQEPRLEADTTAIKRPSKSTRSGEKPAQPSHKITPFAAVRSPAQSTNNDAIDRNIPINPNPINTQALIDAVSPSAASTAKKVRNKVSFPPNNEVDTPTRRDKNRAATPPVLAEASPVSPFEITGFEFSAGSNSSTSHPANPPDPPPIESTRAPSESSLPPIGSALPLSSTTSTGTKQDGQHVEDLDNFDLNQAIADAGTFLQSWDIEKDLRSFSGNVHSSAPGPERQSILNGS